MTCSSSGCRIACVICIVRRLLVHVAKTRERTYKNTALRARDTTEEMEWPGDGWMGEEVEKRGGYDIYIYDIYIKAIPNINKGEYCTNQVSALNGGRSVVVHVLFAIQLNPNGPH